MDKVLAIDVGSGTQDILLYESGKEIQNCTKIISPSRTNIVASQIEAITKKEAGVYLKGSLMGGGPCVKALRLHLESGLPVAATEETAKIIKDDLRKVQSLGIKIAEEKPDGFHEIWTGDIDTKALKGALELLGAEMPTKAAVAVQDHGFNPSVSNRFFRFQYWKKFLEQGGKLADLAYRTPPDFMTRMKAALSLLPADSIVMDTCSAAVMGALEDPVVKERQNEGIVIVNIGNQHTFALLLKGDSVQGLFEHHTKVIDEGKLSAFIERLKVGDLNHHDIFADGGHGCHIIEKPVGDYSLVAVTGPRRNLAKDLGYYFVNPHGDMMLSGCFGLINAYKSLQNN